MALLRALLIFFLSFACFCGVKNVATIYAEANICRLGFVGYDCSQRVCPAAKAWADFPSANNTAHAEYTECSNMGACDRATGLCSCRPGFSGPACENMLCQLGQNNPPIFGNPAINFPCGGHGKCVTLREISSYIDYITYFNSSSYTDWDADRIRGCLCDPGFQGVACGDRSCPKGDDPLTNGTNAIQLLDCKCTNCFGGLKILFRGELSETISHDASAAVIKLVLQEMASIEDIAVTFVHGTQLCSVDGSVTKVEFKIPQGNQPKFLLEVTGGLVANTSTHWNGGSSSLLTSYSSVTGTKEHVECSGRGTCDYALGRCRCYKGYASSNGLGSSGIRADCGYRYVSGKASNYTVTNSTIHTNTTIRTSCPYVNKAVCAGHGSCYEPTGVCTCNAGYGGSSCQNMTCLSTPTWFGGLGVLGHQGTESVCGGVGYCNGTSGLCLNCGGPDRIFTGTRCQTMTCYSSNSTSSGVCSGHGACLTLRELAGLAYNGQKELSVVSYTSPWDADMIRGCACARAISINNQYDQEYLNHFTSLSCAITSNSTYGNSTCDERDSPLTEFYRGPFAFAATDYSAYHCGHAKCPHGDDPRLDRGTNQIQLLNCQAVGGTFQLTFRENTTLPISFNATTHNLKYRLEQLFTIREVSVRMLNRTGTLNSVCSKDGLSDVLVEFTTEYGDLPLLRPVTSSLNHTGVYISVHQEGSKSDIECSGVGICDEFTGRCRCKAGFASSNGSISAAGSTGDCSYFNSLYTLPSTKMN